MYGSGGLKNRTEGLVIERFKDHSEKDFFANRLTKIIINPRCVLEMNVHDAARFLSWKLYVNSNGEKLEHGVYMEHTACHDKIRINHYFTKSYEEFLTKTQRGFADKTGAYQLDYFYGSDRNEVKNDTVMDKYIPLIYKKLNNNAKLFQR